MPHVAGSSSGSGGGNSGGGNSVVVAGGSGSSSSSSGRIRDDPNDCDEVKVFKCEEDEGEGSSDDVMNDDKRDLIRATECDQKGRLSPLSPLSPGSYSSGGGHSSYPKNGGQSSSLRPDPSSLVFGGSGGKLEVGGMPYPTPINIGLLGNLGYHYPNGSPLTGIGRLLGFQCGGMDGLTPPPPPAHMGFPGLSRQYPFGVGYPYAGLGSEVSQMSPWPQGMYPSISNAGSAGGSPGFRYSSSLSSSFPSDIYRQYPPMLPGSGLGGHPGLGHLVGQQKHDAHPHLDNHRSSLSDQKSSDNHHSSKNASDSGQSSNSQNEKKKPHIKKPLNAFMLYMKEMRAKVVAECTLKESAAINQILGRRWHALGREEQAKYYELARRERQLHMQMYPNWSSAQNRTHHEKKRKKKQDQKFDGGNSMKKCRARYGLDQQSQWCKPCRRKKKCIRYLEEANNGTGGSGGANSVNSADDNLGSAGSAGEPLSPESKAGDSDMDTSSNMDMSSPNYSLTSPGIMSMASPGMSLPSPALTSPSGVMPSPIASLASPAVSLPSLQSPMTPSMSEDRHPISSVSSAASSVNFTTTASNGTSSSHHQQHATSSSSHHHNSSRNLNNNINNIANNNHHNHPSNSSSSSSGFGKQQHHSNNFHPGSSPNFGFGLGHLFNGSSVPNGGMGYPFPFPLGLNLPNFQKPARNPVGTNPHDINNPLSVNQLTGQCNSSSSSASSLSSITSNERSSSVSSQKSSHSSSHNHNHHRSDRARSRDRINVTNSDNKSSPENKTNPVPTPVIGVSS